MSQNHKPKIIILGAGPSGLAAAWQLGKRQLADVVVIERNDTVGGNTGSFDVAGLSVDFGSHRLHPACDEKLLDDIRGLLGDDLLDRPRHGRIRLRGRWIHFPLKPVDLVLRLPWSFGLGAARDAVFKRFSSAANIGQESYATILQQGLGKTICRDFYFPYAEKIWGVSPTELDATQARRRVSAGSIGKLIKKVLAAVPGLRAPGAGRFYYPRKGFGQIADSLASAAKQSGAQILLGTQVKQVAIGPRLTVTVAGSDGERQLEADYVWSTIPMNVLSQIMKPAAPTHVIDAANSLATRAMVLIYLVLETGQFTPFDAHYFPETDIKLTRLSEPKNYAARTEPIGQTVLCGELPCQVDDDIWLASDKTLGEIVQDSLARCGLPIDVPVLQVVTRRLPHAYPIYHTGYAEHFKAMDDWLSTIEGLLTFGRQGLFAHDNTHHTMAMAYAAVACLQSDSGFDQARWQAYRHDFETHVVED